jgi:hypothetical protein
MSIGSDTAEASIFAAIELALADVMAGRCGLTVCLRCHEKSAVFSLHQRRRRGLRVIVDGVVYVRSIVLARWRCSHCRATVTEYPWFVLPYKRYASSCLLPRAAHYLEHDQATYESSVRQDAMPCGYATEENAPVIDERALHRSTLWRLVGYLGALTVSLQWGLNLWQQRYPTSLMHRFTGQVAPHKYRTPQRAETLRIARRLLYLQTHWDAKSAVRFFPRFATRSGVP